MVVVEMVVIVVVVVVVIVVVEVVLSLWLVVVVLCDKSNVDVLDGFLLSALDDPDWLRDLRQHLRHRGLPCISRLVDLVIGWTLTGFAI